MATGYVYINGSPYHDAEGLSHIRSCRHNYIINAARIIGGEMTNWNFIDSVHLED